MTRIARILVVMVVFASACESPTAPVMDQEGRPDVRPFVTSRAGQWLDGFGRFDVAWTCGPYEGYIMEQSHAEALAVWFAKKFLASRVSLGGLPPAGRELEEAHGHTIDWERVRAGIRPTTCAESLFKDVSGGFHQAFLNHHGPYYLVPISVEADQVALLAVAAASPMFVGEDGRGQARFGNEFRWASSPHGHFLGNPLSAESAVKFAADTLGALIDSLPRLLRADQRVVPFAAVWELRLDREVTVTRVTDRSAVRTSVVYVGLYPSFTDFVRREYLVPRLFVPDTIQPPTQEIPVMYEDGSGEILELPLRNDVPMHYWEVEAAGA